MAEPLSEPKLSQRHSLKLNAREMFDHLSKSYDFVLEYVTLFQDRYWKKELIKMLGKVHGKYILDLGCGTGVLEERIHSFGCDVVGVDISENMIRICKEKGLNVSLVVGDAESLPFRDGVFNSIISCYIAKYCDIDKLRIELSRLLKKGGKLVIYDFQRPKGALSFFYSFYINFVMKVIAMILHYSGSKIEMTFIRLPEIIKTTDWDEELKTTLAVNGFRIISVKSLTFGAVHMLLAMKD